MIIIFLKKVLHKLYTRQGIQFFFQEENTEKPKLKCYNLMIQLDQREGSSLSIHKHYRTIYDIPWIQAEGNKWQQALKNVVLYVILSPYDN